MNIRLELDEPKVVARGPELKEVGWGTHQFPSVNRLNDGRIAVKYHIVHDDAESYGLESGWAISDDEGNFWSDVPAGDVPSVKAQFGTLLPSGRRLRAITPRPCPIPKDLYQELLCKSGGRRNGFPVEDMPDGYFEKDKWLFGISEPGSVTEKEFLSKIDFPGMTLRLTKDGVVRPDAFGPVCLAPDGSVWVAHYENGRNPVNLGFTSYYACYFFRSLDEGKSFRLMSWIQYLPDTNEFPDAFTTEGFCEPYLAFMPDGSMIALMRTGSGTPSYLSRSVDGGITWGKPVRFDDCGVFPQLLSLKSGITLASYGRPGIYVRATDDPSGLMWQNPVEILPRDELVTRSCCYTGMLALDESNVLLVYSDFQYPDKTGIKRKTILSRRIHICS